MAALLFYAMRLSNLLHVMHTSNLAFWTSFAGLCLVLLAPLTIVDYPPVLDYPNHLARMVVLASGRNDPILSQMYVSHWAIIPNLSMDVFVPPLLHLLGPHKAGCVTLGIALVTPLIGTVAYSRAAFRSVSLWSLGAGLIAYNECLMLGFLNFSAAIGLALVFAAAWVRWHDVDRLLSSILAAVGCVVLFFFHVLALVYFSCIVVSHDAASVWGRLKRGEPFLCEACRRVLVIGFMLAGPVTLYFFSQFQAEDSAAEFRPPGEKAEQILAPFVNYLPKLDILAACLVLGAFALGLFRRWLHAPLPSVLALTLLFALFLVAPARLKDGANIDLRFIIMLGFLAFGGISTRAPPPFYARLVTVLFTFLLFARIGTISLVWYVHRTDVAELRTVMSNVEPGSSVFVTAVTPQEEPLSERLALRGRRATDRA